MTSEITTVIGITDSLSEEASAIVNEITTAAGSVSETVTEIAAEITEEVSTMAGVWGSLGGTNEMQFLDTLPVAIIGFAIVFAVLGFLAIFVYVMGKVFDTIAKKKDNEKASESKAESTTSAAPAATGYPLPENQSMGDLTLINVTEEEAAVIMAVISAKTNIPLNRLKFNSIKLLED